MSHWPLCFNMSLILVFVHFNTGTSESIKAAIVLRAKWKHYKEWDTDQQIVTQKKLAFVYFAWYDFVSKLNLEGYTFG